MSETTSACFVWKDPSSFSVDAICLTVGKRSLGQVENIVCCSSVSASELGQRFPSIQAFLLNECRASGLLCNKHTTYFSHGDLILALRMHIDIINRKDIDNGGSLTASDLSICYQRYLKCFPEESSEWNLYEKTISAYRDFIRTCNAVDDCSLGVLLSTLEGCKVTDNLQKKNLLVLGSPLGIQERALLKLLLRECKLYSVTIETPLDSSFCQSSLNTEDGEVDSDQVILSELTWQMLEDQIQTDGLSEISLSSEQRYEEDVILSFLRLVVNVRDELALIKALMSPLVSLPQLAFLHLKRQATLKELSICQTLISYVIRVKLGGVSYAPSQECPLKEYLPQLTNFTEVLEKLQTIVEEETNSQTAVKKVLLCVTKSLLKLSGSSFRHDRLQAAIEKLNLLVCTLVKKESSQGPASELVTTELLQRLLDWCSSQCYASPLGVCFGMSKTGATPKTAISPFTFFRTPEEVSAEEMPSLSERISSSNRSQTPVCTKKFQAGLPWGIDPNNVEKPKENIDSVLSGGRPVYLPVSSLEQQSGIKRQRVKRSILWKTTNKNPFVQSDKEDASDKRSGPEDTKTSRGTNKENILISEFLNEGSQKENILNQGAQCKRNDKNQNEISVNRKRKRKEKPILKGQTNIKAFFNQRI